MFEKIREIICNKFGLELDDISLETSFRDDLDADSLSLFELVLAFEYEFGVDMDNEITDNIFTVKDAVIYLESLIDN